MNCDVIYKKSVFSLGSVPGTEAPTILGMSQGMRVLKSVFCWLWDPSKDGDWFPREANR